jgi:hypothetical protein
VSYAQFGEDAILARFAAQLNAPHYFVDIGCGDGEHGSNTRAFAEIGWSGLWIDANMDAIAKAREACPWVNTYCAKIDLQRANYLTRFAPREFGILSIDIDGNDYHIWKAVCSTAWRPYLVCIEAQIQIPHDVPYIMPYDEHYVWDHKTHDCGASIVSLVDLGKEMGYCYLGKHPDEHSPNLFFVREDLRGRLDQRDCVEP